jgi:CheY-like chemotaxis protein
MKRICLIEDEATTALFFSFLLKKAGYIVCCKTTSGEEALTQLQYIEMPDLVLLDLGLAGKMDGIVTARKLREKAAVPLLFVSGYDDAQTNQRLQEFNNSAYLSKPVRPELLLQKIKELLSEMHAPE